MNSDEKGLRQRSELAELYRFNTPEAFWRPLISPAATPEEWVAATRMAATMLPGAVEGRIEDILLATLGEEMFGSRRWQLGAMKRLYYQLKPVLPRFLTWPLRRRYTAGVREGFPIGWPEADGYARFLWSAADFLRQWRNEAALPFIHFWPHGRRMALVLTHDIEESAGQAFVSRVADLEESLGFRSSFNFVLDRYPIDMGLIADLRARGFEVGGHGLKHDGKLFSSRATFERRVRIINRRLRELDARGFRSPLTHRNPIWMQALDIDYDSSFFDTDPFEPMPGGTMSLWPFRLGRFWELPYTLPQDYVLTDTLREETPQIWLNKVEFIARHCGMALLNVHPDYLTRPADWQIYSHFLEAMSERQDAWPALPSEVWRWWEARAVAGSPDDLDGGVPAALNGDGEVYVQASEVAR